MICKNAICVVFMPLGGSENACMQPLVHVTAVVAYASQA